MTRIAFLGPPGTFTEEALLSQVNLVKTEIYPRPSFPEVLEAVTSGEVDMGFVPIENSIEGTVSETLDGLIFEHNLLIQKEIVWNIHLNVLGLSSTRLEDVKKVVSIPHAVGQCRKFLRKKLPSAELVAANSTAEAAKYLSQHKSSTTVALAPALAAKLYGLEIIAENVEDHSDNQTRFVMLAPQGIPAPTGHDRTSIVCFQRTDQPGNLHSILGHFAARSINLTKLESRPTKQALGQYCFIIDLEGHIANEIVADCLRDLHVSLSEIKFLGSYPAASEHGKAIRRRVQQQWAKADAWIESLKEQIQLNSKSS